MGGLPARDQEGHVGENQRKDVIYRSQTIIYVVLKIQFGWITNAEYQEEMSQAHRLMYLTDGRPSRGTFRSYMKNLCMYMDIVNNRENIL
jgi:hypothetical protein